MLLLAQELSLSMVCKCTGQIRQSLMAVLPTLRVVNSTVQAYVLTSRNAMLAALVVKEGSGGILMHNSPMIIGSL